MSDETILKEEPGTPTLCAESFLVEPDPGEAPVGQTGVDAGDGYEDLGLLGEGGMGEVRRVRDLDLNRVMAMKVIRADLMKRPVVLARFIEEAQCSAQLQHPGIVPVHELGRLPDGRIYFTMREVRGRTLGEVIRELHAAHPEVGEAATTRRLVDAFVKVCEAVGYAHSRGVVHRDLKPANIMVGEHGEVLVVDWGLAKVRGARDRAAEAGELDVVVTHRSASGSAPTRMGVVAGTPAYMPPEQARGEIDRIDARSDVYALGALLYEILEGRPPYEGETAKEVLAQVLFGPPIPLGQVAGSPRAPLPAELVSTCTKAMARDPADRHADAAELAAEVIGWLEGARRREHALEIVVEAEALEVAAAQILPRVAALRREAVALLEGVAAWEPEERKAPGWAKEEEALVLERKREALDLEAGQRLQGALQVDPDSPEVHAALAARHGAAHAAAEEAREAREVARAEALLRIHAGQAVPEQARRWAAYLEGTGALTLRTEPAGAEVLLYRYEVENRRLVPRFQRSLGHGPLAAVPLPMGSYLCLIRHPDFAELRYPVSIGRGEHWDGVPPGALEPAPLFLPRPGELGPDDRLVSPGWFWSGGDLEGAEALPRRRLWCDGLVVKRFPVTNRQYLAFLDALVAAGREAEALRHAPRARPGTLGEEGALMVGRDPQGRFILVRDRDGDAWDPDWPAIHLDFACAVAFARHQAARTELPWRLPGELEWEKAARGVDGRLFPWGDVLDPAWCCFRDSHAGRALPSPVDSFPVDESPYGVRGMAGNAQNWCADLYLKEGPPCEGDRVEVPPLPTELELAEVSRRARRGGSWSGFSRFTRSGNRFGFLSNTRLDILGFRLVRSFRWPTTG